MSAKATKAIPTAAGSSAVRSSNDTSGIAERSAGRPGHRRRPAPRPRARAPQPAAVAPTTATKTPGTFGATRRRPRITSERRGADRERGRVGLVESRDEVAHCRQEALRVDREPEELRELRDHDGHGNAHQVAEAHGHRQQFGHEAEAREPAREHDRTDEDREQAGERDPSRRVPGRRQRNDRRGDERRDRRVGSEDQDPRRAQQEVHDQRDERRVEPGDRRQARELGVGHSLRDEQRGEDDARDDVAAQVRRRGGVAATQAPGTQRRKPSRAFHGRDSNEPWARRRIPESRRRPVPTRPTGRRNRYAVARKRPTPTASKASRVRRTVATPSSRNGRRGAGSSSWRRAVGALPDARLRESAWPSRRPSTRIRWSRPTNAPNRSSDFEEPRYKRQTKPTQAR